MYNCYLLVHKCIVNGPRPLLHGATLLRGAFPLYLHYRVYPMVLLLVYCINGSLVDVILMIIIDSWWVVSSLTIL